MVKYIIINFEKQNPSPKSMSDFDKYIDKVHAEFKADDKIKRSMKKDIKKNK